MAQRINSLLPSERQTFMAPSLQIVHLQTDHKVRGLVFGESGAEAVVAGSVNKRASDRNVEPREWITGA